MKRSVASPLFARKPNLGQCLLRLLISDAKARIIANEYCRKSSCALPVSALVAFILFTQAVFLCFNQTLFQLKLAFVLQTLMVLSFGVWSVRAGGTYLNAPLLFLSGVYVWHTPLLLGHYFALGPSFQYMYTVFSYGEEFVFKAVALVSMCIAMTAFGCYLAYLRERRCLGDPRSRRLIQERCYSALGSKAERAARWVLFGMLLVFGAYLAHAGRTVFQKGYFSIYQDPDTSLLATLYYRTQFLWVFVIILLVAYRRHRPKALAGIVLLVVGLCVVFAMFGDRSLPFICLTAMIIGIDSFVGRVRLVALASFVLFLSAASYVISQTRNSGLGTNVFDFSRTGKSLDLMDFVYPTSGIIRDVLRTMDFCQNYSPLYGKTFAAAALSVFPEPILNRLHYHEPTPPSMWLVENSPDLEPGHGIGYSLVAEVYYNFRMPGCVLFALFGFSIATGYFRYIFRNDIFTLILTMFVAGLLMLNMRNDVIDYFRLIVYVAALLAYLKSARREVFQQQMRSARGEIVRQHMPPKPGVGAFDPC